MESIENLVNVYGPQFINSPAKTTIINDAKTQLSSTAFGENYNRAVAFLACHVLTLINRQSGDAGAVQSKSENGSSINYAVKADIDSLNATWYGQELKKMIRQTGCFVTISNGSDLTELQ